MDVPYRGRCIHLKCPPASQLAPLAADTSGPEYADRLLYTTWPSTTVNLTWFVSSKTTTSASKPGTMAPLCWLSPSAAAGLLVAIGRACQRLRWAKSITFRSARSIVSVLPARPPALVLAIPALT